MNTLLRFLLAAVVLSFSGCAAQPRNPSFPVSSQTAEQDLKRMAADPRPLQRPLVVIGGFLDPGIAALVMERQFGSVTRGMQIVSVELGECCTLEDCRSKIVKAVSAACGADAAGTAEVDVVGVSLGGLAARYAAMTQDGAAIRHLRIARLFTISSPHLGAEDADRLPLLHPMQKELRSHSTELTRLNALPPPYPVYPYVRLGDRVVGVENAAPPGQTPWWLPIEWFSPPHAGALFDARILADISRRLRGEAPLTIPPATVPPTI